MAKPKRKPSTPVEGAPRKAEPTVGAELRVFPHQLRPGDHVIDEEGKEWEVVDHPAAYRQGKRAKVRLRAPGKDAIEERDWPAHERFTVRRSR